MQTLQSAGILRGGKGAAVCPSIPPVERTQIRRVIRHCACGTAAPCCLAGEGRAGMHLRSVICRQFAAGALVAA